MVAASYTYRGVPCRAASPTRSCPAMVRCPSRATAVRRGQIAASITSLGALRRLVRQCLDELLEDGELLVVVRLGGDGRAIEDGLAHEDARRAAHRERDGVGRAAIHLDLAVGDLHEDASVKHSAAGLVRDEILDHD